jgi:hypothetical protein
VAAFDYPKTRATAERLIERFGRSAVLVRMTKGGGPASDPGPATPANHACKVVITNYSDRDRDDTVIKTGDRKILLSTAGLAIIPALSDRLSVDGESFQIVDIKTLDPGGVKILWTLQARL